MSSSLSSAAVGGVHGDDGDENENDKNNDAFSLLVVLSFVDVLSQEHFRRDITPVAKYVNQLESHTTWSYQILQSVDRPHEMMVLERYQDKMNAYATIHKSSDPFLQFRPKLQAMANNQKVQITGESYQDRVEVADLGRSSSSTMTTPTSTTTPTVQVTPNNGTEQTTTQTSAIIGFMHQSLPLVFLLPCQPILETR